MRLASPCRRILLEWLESRTLLATVQFASVVEIAEGVGYAVYDPWRPESTFRSVLVSDATEIGQQQTDATETSGQTTQLTFDVSATADFGHLHVGDRIGFAIKHYVDSRLKTATIVVVGPDGENVADLKLTHTSTAVQVQPFRVDLPGTYVLQTSVPLEAPVVLYFNTDFEHESANPNDSSETSTTLGMPELGSPVAVAGGFGDHRVNLFHETFDADGLPSGWMTHASHASSEVQVGGGTLVLRTGSNPDGPKLGLGVVIDYNSSTGHVRVEANPSALSTLEIKSDSGLFLGPRHPIFDQNVFNVFHLEKLFILDFSGPEFDIGGGINVLDLGEILPPGLTQEALEGDLSIRGSYWAFPGSVGEVALTVDNDRQALPKPVGAAVAAVEIPIAPQHVVSLRGRYWFETQAGMHAEDVSYVIWTSQDDGDRWTRNMHLGRCELVCEFGTTFSSNVNRIKIESSALNTSLVIDDLFAQTVGPSADWFDITIPPGEVVSIEPHAPMNVRNGQFDLFDADGQSITKDVQGSVYLASSGSSAETFRLTVQPQFHALSRAEHSFVDYQFVVRLEDTGQLDPHQLNANASFKQVSLTFSQPVNPQSCSLQDFDWDGPPFTELEFRSAESVALKTSDAFSEGRYELTVRIGACGDLAGRPLVENQHTLDYALPTFVSVETGIPLGPIVTRSSTTFLDASSPDGDGRLQRPGVSEIEFVVVTPDFGHTEGVLPQDIVSVEIVRIDDSNKTQADTPDGSQTDVGVNVDANSSPSPAVVEERTLLDDGESNREFPLGDRNKDGVFDDLDLATLADIVYGTSATLQTGDYNGDGYFTSSDLVVLFQTSEFGVS